MTRGLRQARPERGKHERVSRNRILSVSLSVNNKRRPGRNVGRGRTVGFGLVEGEGRRRVAERQQMDKRKGEADGAGG